MRCAEAHAGTAVRRRAPPGCLAPARCARLRQTARRSTQETLLPLFIVLTLGSNAKWHN